MKKQEPMNYKIKLDIFDIFFLFFYFKYSVKIKNKQDYELMIIPWIQRWCSCCRCTGMFHQHQEWQREYVELPAKQVPVEEAPWDHQQWKSFLRFSSILQSTFQLEYAQPSKYKEMKWPVIPPGWALPEEKSWNRTGVGIIFGLRICLLNCIYFVVFDAFDVFEIICINLKIFTK